MKFRKIGAYKEVDPVDSVKTRKMKKREVPYSAFSYTDPQPDDREKLKAALEHVKAKLSEDQIDKITSPENLTRLERELSYEWNKALLKFDLFGEASVLHNKIGDLLGDPYAEGDLTPDLQARVDKLGKTLLENLGRPENARSLRQKFMEFHFALNLRIFLKGEEEWRILDDDEESDDEDDVEWPSAAAGEREGGEVERASVATGKREGGDA
jgi:hypothetical protein